MSTLRLPRACSGDIRTDIYSLGCTLFHLLAGRAPFSAPQYDSPMKKLLAHIHDEPPAIEFVRADIPKPVAVLVGQMLAKAPQVRPASPSAVIDALAPFCEGSKLIGLLREARRKEQPAAEPEPSRVETGELRGSMDVETSRDASQMQHREEPPGEPLEFDPYHRWLGIPREEQPANHYRFLGIPVLEADAEVIRDAAARQMAHVRTYHLGRHGDLSQRILNQLAAAKACLLNPKKKAAYDATLREELQPASRTHEPIAGGPEVAAAVPPMSSQSLEIRLPRISPSRRWSGQHRVLPRLEFPKRALVGVAVGAAMLVLLLGIALSMRTSEGTLVVEIDDPEATVQVLGDEQRVLVQGRGEKGTLVLGVDPGKRRLRVEKDGIVLFTQDFTIAPGGKETIRVRLENPDAERSTGALQRRIASSDGRAESDAGSLLDLPTSAAIAGRAGPGKELAPPGAADRPEPARWLGYGSAEAGSVDEIADYTNIVWTGNEATIEAARHAGLRVVIPFEDKGDLEKVQSRVLSMATAYGDAVVAVCWELPFFSGHTPSEVAAFGQRLKQAAPRVQVWCNCVYGKESLRGIALPKEVDALAVEMGYVTTATAVQAKASRIMQERIAKANGRPVFLIWWHGHRKKPQGIVPECQPGIMRALGNVVDQYGLKGLFVVGYDSGSQGAVGMKTSPMLVSEIRDIAKQWAADIRDH